MESTKEKDNPGPDGTAHSNNGIFMRLKSNILNRLSDENIPTLRVRELLTESIYSQMKVYLENDTRMHYLDQGLNEGP